MRVARTLPGLALAGLGVGLLVLPWYALPEGAPPAAATGRWWTLPALAQLLAHGRHALAVPLLIAAAATLAFGLARERRRRAWLWLALGLVGAGSTLLRGS
jgi:hypothetical protein